MLATAPLARIVLAAPAPPTEVARTLALAQGQVATSLAVAARSLALAQPQYPALVRAAGRRFQSSQSATVSRKGALGVVLTLEQASVGVSAVHFATGAFTLAQAQPVSLRVVAHWTRSISQASAVRLVRRVGRERALSASATVRLVRGKTARRSLAQGQSVATMTAVIRHSIFSVAAGQAVFFGTGARCFAVGQRQDATLTRVVVRSWLLTQGQSGRVVMPVKKGRISADVLEAELVGTVAANDLRSDAR